MSRNTSRTRRIFGGKEPQGAVADVGSAAYARPLNNPTDQDASETLAVATHYRKFPGPSGLGEWSYHVNPTSAAGAASALTFWYSNLPDPDPTNAAHWVDSGISSIDLTATTDAQASVTGKYFAWIMAKAVVAASTGALWAYVRVAGVEE